MLPYLLALTPFLPPPLALWLTRVTPAAALAVQQTVTRYPQVDSVYTPAYGYYPLPPWAGLAVLCGYTAARPRRGRRPAAPEGRMSCFLAALRAEWTKLRTTPGPAWLLLVAVDGHRGVGRRGVRRRHLCARRRAATRPGSPSAASTWARPRSRCWRRWPSAANTAPA